ncbi:MAG: FAD-dependent oxidoreductase [Proteobacteria bacterium]|nr:FAD-dependent oxidoreductase [Pseudomonadota bacterium]
MTKIINADICVIGAGSAGLSIAAGASQMGARTVLVERGRMGGDCLNYGCVPSKALLAAAKAANAHRLARRMGVGGAAPEIDFQAVHDHVRGVIESIAPQDSVERFEAMGVTVVRAGARFTGPREVEAGDTRIRARRFVVATGSLPMVPPIPGLDALPYLTNETVFDLSELPGHLIVVGGGPIGCELGQAFRRLGARVSLLEMASILPKDDPELVDILRTKLREDGMEILEGARVASVEGSNRAVAVTVERDGETQRLSGSTLLIVAGRRPAVDDLDLQAAGIEFDRGGVKVDARLRTTNRRVYAAGDVVGGYQFTHMAGHHASVVIKNALFRLPAKVETRAVPWVTYTDPELAHVGLSEEAARRTHGRIRVLRWPFAENDRARAERRTDGLVKVVATPRGRILGASILGAHAGESIQPWILAISRRIGLSAMAGTIAPYPTLGEASKRAAASFYAEKMFSERTKRLVRLLLRLG